MRTVIRCALVLCCFALGGYAQIDLADTSVKRDIVAPTLSARFSIGFNYDYLRAPTDVSFEYPKGYFGMNVPVQKSMNPLDLAKMFNPAIDTILSDSTLFRGGEEFKPSASARQNPNTTFRVDVPMLGGVGSFSNMRNVGLNFTNSLGIPNLYMGLPSSAGIGAILRGSIAVPLDLSTSWESMTFGYAYRVNKNLLFAFNLHRHVFLFDFNAKVNVDMLGNVDVNQAGLNIRIPLNYALSGGGSAHYDAEAWSYSMGATWWRLGWTSRFGINTRAKGYVKMDYSLPFFIDKETFKVTLDMNNITDLATINKLISNETSVYKDSSENEMVWKMPDAHTFTFDLVRDHLSLSYTKLNGVVGLSLPNILKFKKQNLPDTATTNLYDTISLDFKMTVDNVMMVNANFKNLFVNIGVFTLDFGTGDQAGLLSSAFKSIDKYPTIGGAPLMPILNFGSAIGTKLQLQIELDVLPLMALKAGINYYF